MPQQRSDIRTVLDRVKARLVDKKVLGDTGTETADRVRVVNRPPERIPATMGDKFLYLRPRRENPAGRFDGGSGRIDRRTYRLIEVLVFTRQAGLNEIDDAATLINEDLSHFLLEDTVIDCLDLHFLKDADENFILFEPMRWVGGPSDPDPAPNKKEWLCSVIQFEVGYQRNLTQ